MDEPTSGLDSFTAVRICKLLKKLAREQGKTICATIHQPSSQAFAFFDRIILMCDGNIVYQGIATESTNYFKSMGYKVRQYDNPTDVFMRILSINYPKQQEDEDKITKLVTKYEKEQLQSVVDDDTNFPMPELDMSRSGNIGQMAPFKV